MEPYVILMDHAPLKEITPHSHQWTVRVRAIRFSECKNKEQPPKIVRVDFILIDEQGTTMEAQIPQNWIHMFMPQLKEASLYYIQFFQVVSARTTYRPVDHPFLARFTVHTRVREITTIPPTFPEYAYRVAPFEVLRARKQITEYCSDTIGVLQGCTHVRMQNTRAGPKAIRNVRITDGKDTMVVALWGEQAENFDAERYMEMATREPVIFLFVGVTASIFNGNVSLQGSSVCKWYVNPHIPEVAALRDSCIGRTPTPIWDGPGTSQAAPENITVADLSTFDNPHVIYGNRYIVKVKIKNVLTDTSWWYLACQVCNKTLKQESGATRCTGRGCSGTSGGPRYRLSIVAVDPAASANTNATPTIELVFFGPIAEEIIGMPVDALIALDGPSNAFLPTRITALYGRQFELRVSVSPMSLQRIGIIYQVDTVLATGDTSSLHQNPQLPEELPIVSASDTQATIDTQLDQPSLSDAHATPPPQHVHLTPEITDIHPDEKKKRAIGDVAAHETHDGSSGTGANKDRNVQRRLEL
ncbi:replication protein A 70 kDa DNA-binding subunit D-like [Miscanthus floridulus]|uniref:replication protein A 70 kDa DNA-binding subunit D-like n=1 Tax=Miscanthus floridulus TaxID=154761 RepID=UPI0034589EA1